MVSFEYPLKFPDCSCILLLYKKELWISIAIGAALCTERWRCYALVIDDVIIDCRFVVLLLLTKVCILVQLVFALLTNNSLATDTLAKFQRDTIAHYASD